MRLIAYTPLTVYASCKGIWQVYNVFSSFVISQTLNTFHLYGKEVRYWASSPGPFVFGNGNMIITSHLCFRPQSNVIIYFDNQLTKCTS